MNIKSILFFIGFVACIAVTGLIEDPDDHEVDTSKPAPHEGYIHSQRWIQDQIAEDPQFRKDYEEAQLDF
jgi:hypothetical protein